MSPMVPTFLAYVKIRRAAGIDQFDIRLTDGGNRVQDPARSRRRRPREVDRVLLGAFGVEPAKRKPGYANFAITEPPLELVLLENPGSGGSINHLGIEVESSDTVKAEIARLSEVGLVTVEELGTTCCYATQDKVWATAPDSEKWEIYTVLAGSDTFGSSPELLLEEKSSPCCGG